MKTFVSLVLLTFFYFHSFANSSPKENCNEKKAKCTEEIKPEDKTPLGKKAPRIAVEDINGKWINSKKWKGKVVVVNFWFTTCPPCIKEMPELNKLYDSYKDNKEVEFLAVTWQKKPQVQFFLLRNQLKLPVVASQYETASSFGVTGYPTNVIINKEGIISFYEKGYKKNIYDLMNNAIQKAL